MKYRIKLMGGEQYFISDEEFNKLPQPLVGFLAFRSLRGMINTNSITSILPEDKIDKSNQTTGRLHDGVRVVKQFGQWKDADSPDVCLDSSYYPEITLDSVMTEEEYQETKLKQLP